MSIFLQTPETYLINLPGGGVATISATATFGELAIAAGLGVVATLLIFDLLRAVAHMASKR
jgi:hypothetical protein